MANDYLFLRCKTCGKHLRFAGYYPSLPAPTIHGAELAAFIGEHWEQCRQPDQDLGDDAGFELHTEGTLPCLQGEEPDA